MNKKHSRYYIYGDQRIMAEWLVMLSQKLNPKDRVLLELYFDRGVSISQLSVLLGYSRSTIHRKLSSITRRVRLYRNFLIVHNENDAIACDYFFRGLPACRIAEKYGCTVYRVRSLIEQANRQQARGREACA